VTCINVGNTYIGNGPGPDEQNQIETRFWPVKSVLQTAVLKEKKKGEGGEVASGNTTATQLQPFTCSWPEEGGGGRMRSS